MQLHLDIFETIFCVGHICDYNATSLQLLLGVLGFINVYFECIQTTILDVYSSIVISINGFNIMITLNNVYFKYITILCQIFVKYIVPILQVYPNHLIILLEIITNDILLLLLLLLYVFILITCNRK